MRLDVIEFFARAIDSRKVHVPKSIMISKHNFNEIMEQMRDKPTAPEVVLLVDCKFVVDAHIAEDKAVITWPDGKITFVSLQGLQTPF